jgi:hypothetical protein
MRLVYLTTCAAALVACSDVRVPTAPGSPSSRSIPAGSPAEPGTQPEKFDPRSLTDRVEALVAARFGKVSLPPDAFSQSADAVHPDIACPSGGWNGGKCWLMYTPYKNSDPSWENPGFLVAATDTNWVTPLSIRNPIVPFPGVGKYNSDPDHAFDPVTKRLVQVFRVVGDTMNRIMIMSTANAQQWTTPVVAFAARSHDAVSPSLIIESDRTAKVWYIKSGAPGCNAQSTTVELRTAHPDSTQAFETATWSDPVQVTMTIPGYTVWHIDVAELPFGGYVALIAAFQKGNTCGQSDLWLARSDDGLAWRTLPLPIFWRGMTTASQRKISTWYRGTLRYDPQTDLLDIWPSALAGPSWTIYHTAIRLGELSDLMASAKPSDVRRAVASSRRVAGATIRMP